ncbi:tail fiber/spike domain-containing protein, partial [Klebsiella michiganensis]|nr:hypothetical protein [Klebsiella michiganensis]
MTRMPESSLWEEEIELISRSERVSGGMDGVANRPLKSLANRTRFLKDAAENSDQAIAEKVSAVATFIDGATLDSSREEILYGSYRLVWTGLFPKEVPPGSTPKSTGGVGPGGWAFTSDAIIRQNLASSDGFKLTGQVSSATALAGLPGSEGDRVLLMGYNPGWAATKSELSGCGEFYYVGSLADVNNGVTIFNGWCRKFKDTVITTYDAGLGDNDGVDARERLNTLFKVVPAGFTVKIRGYHIVSGPLKAEEKKDLAIDG